MQSFSRGWSFLKQAWGMAFKDKDLLKPSIYTLIVGAIVGVMGAILIVITMFIFVRSEFANVVIYGISAVLIFVQFVVSYVFSGMTAYLIYQYLTEGDGKMEDAWAIIRRDFADILTLAAASTAINLLKNALRNGKNRNLVTSVAGSGVSLLNTLWTEAATLILPAMIIDDLNLKQGVERIWKITKENFLLIGISFIGVRSITGLLTFLFFMLGLVVAAVIIGGAQIVNIGSTLTIISVVLAVLAFFALMIIASVVSAYTNTAYHTCLYIWAREAEKAVARGETAAQAQAPAPLAAVLSAS